MQEKNNRNPINDTGDPSFDNLPQNDLLVNEVDNNESTNTDNLQQEEEVLEQDEKESLKKEVELFKDKYIRLFAEFENYKRRNAKEKIEYIQTAGKEVITSMLEVLDDCDRAEKQMNTSSDIEQIKEGVQLVFNKLRNILQSKGLKAMESINTDFDVEKHEAISEIQVPDKSKKGKVVDEIEKGYYLNDKLIRFAKVVVGK
jgi:molecular chaperone GrpE